MIAYLKHFRCSSHVSSRCLLREAQHSSRAAYARPSFAARGLATAAAESGKSDAGTPPPVAGSSAGSADPKLVTIVDQIQNLTLLEASELVNQLKVSI